MYKKLGAVAAICVISTAALAADLPARKPAASPVQAAPISGIDAFGSLAVGYNWGTISSGSESTDASGLHLAARGTFAAPVSGGFGFQADGSFERSAYGLGAFSQDNFVRNTGELTGHFFSRSASGLIGVVAQSSATELNIGLLSDRRYFLGLEGQYFIGATTLYAQVVYQNANFGFPGSAKVEADGLTVLGQIRHFVAPNAMIALKAGYESVEADLDIGIRHTAWMIGAKGEYRFDASPISAFVDVDYRSGKFNVGNADEHETRAMLGVKYNFGSQTLIDRDRNGASLDPVRSLRAIVPFVFNN